MTHMIELTFNQVKNIVGDGENDGNQHLLLFPASFQKISFLGSFNSASSNNFLDWSKLKTLADYKVNETEKLKLVLGRIESIVGKGEDAGNQNFLLFQQYFQKACFSRLIKVGIVW